MVQPRGNKRRIADVRLLSGRRAAPPHAGAFAHCLGQPQIIISRDRCVDQIISKKGTDL